MNAKTPARPRGDAVRRWILNLALVVAVVLAANWWQTRDLPDGQAPVLSARLVTGEPVNLGHYHGRVLLVHFWAQWCPICRAEQGTIASIARDFPVLTVAMDSGQAAEVRDQLRREGLKFPTIADADGEIAAAWRVRAVPVSFVIDPEGRIRFRAVGYTTELGLRARLLAAERF